MGRVRGFKHEEALDKAIYLFWEKGYENTSLKDLLNEMNILNGSFYNCFKNKKTLFAMALERYTNEYAVDVMELFKSGTSFKENMRVLFENSLRCEDLDRPAGCFIVNCATSDLIEDPEVGELVREKIEGFYSFITEQFIEAQKKGELSSELDPKQTCDIALSYLHGRMKMTKLFPHNEQSKKQIEYFLVSLGI